MNIALINPPKVNGIKFTREGKCQEREEVLGTCKPPLSLAYIASLLKKKNISFEFIDAQVLNLNILNIIEYFKSKNFSPEIIFFPTTTPTISSDIENLKPLKEFFKSKLFAFGPHTSGIPKETLEEFPLLDGAIFGEPEYTALEIAKANNLFDIKGLAFKDGRNIFQNPSRDWILDLDSLPFPLWDSLPLSKYKIPFLRENYLLVETSRGCPHLCSFCVVPLIHGRLYRERSGKSVVEEINFLKEKYKINFFHLWGDTTILNKNFILSFYNELKKRNLKIKFICNGRIDAISEEIVKILKEVGCFMVSFGIESSSFFTRNNMNKKLHLYNIKNVISLMRKEGVKCLTFFILGFPGETKNDLEETINFACELNPDYATFYPAVPYPGTKLYQICREKNILKNVSWSRFEYSYYVIEDKELNENLVLKIKKKAYIKFYLRIKFILRQLKEINSFSYLLDLFKKSFGILNA